MLLQEGVPEELYVRYEPFKGQRITQQVFRPGGLPVKNVKAIGNQMTVKAIDRLSVTKPRWWQDEAKSPPGVLL